MTVLQLPPVEPILGPQSVKSTTITWNASPNAIGYQVKIQDQVVCETRDLSCSVSQLVGPATKVEIISKGNDELVSTEVLPSVQVKKPIPALVVNFATNSFFLNDSAKKEIRKIATIIKREGFKSLTVFGHTDSVGGVDNNVLSQNRAKATAKYLQTLIPNVKVTVDGFAFGKPVASNSTKTGKAANRRAEISITG